MQFLKSNVGRKILMAITGLFMVLFVVLHLLGNSSVYKGPDGINAYGEILQGFGPFIWIFRIFMLIFFLVHIFFGVQLTLENRAATPQAYAVKKNLRATFASKNMIWTGLLIAAYIIYHLLHFTISVISPEISAARNPDAMGRPDIFRMIVLSFQNLMISAVYILAMMALTFHLTHGLPSLFQTLGLNNEKTMQFITRTGILAAIIIFLGYVLIPVVILTGILRLI